MSRSKIWVAVLVMLLAAGALAACEPEEVENTAVITVFPTPGEVIDGTLPLLAITPESGPLDTMITAVGTGFPPGETVVVYANLPGVEPPEIEEIGQETTGNAARQQVATTVVDTDGTFTVDFRLPFTAAGGQRVTEPSIIITASTGDAGEMAEAEYTVEGEVAGQLPGPEDESAAVQAAQQALADELDIDVGEISVVSVRAVEWSDACLGVDQPGAVCAQSVTPGFEVVLEANEQWYWYHTNATGSGVVLAEVGPAGTPTP